MNLSSQPPPADKMGQGGYPASMFLTLMEALQSLLEMAVGKPETVYVPQHQAAIPLGLWFKNAGSKKEPLAAVKNFLPTNDLNCSLLAK